MTDDFLEGLTKGDKEIIKQETFEVSTLSLVLAQLGVDRMQIRHLQAELDSGYNFDWFNSLNQISAIIRTHRVFGYNLLATLDNKAGHPLTKAYTELWDELGDDTDEVHMICKCVDHGRLILSNEPQQFSPYIFVPSSNRSPPYYITPFRDYYRNRYGELLADEELL